MKFVLCWVFAFILFLLGFCHWFSFNVTASQPTGIYLNLGKTDYKKGDLVSVCLPKKIAAIAKKRNYINFAFSCLESFSQPVLKKIVAIEGDKIVVNNTGVFVNKELVKNSQRMIELSEFKKFTEIKLGKNEIFVMSDFNKYSFDSRYFGAINQNNIQYKIKLIWQM